MTVIVKHSKTNAITDWTQAQLDEQIALGNFAPGTTLANIVLPSDWNNNHTLTGLGTMAEQNATAVAITGGTIDNTTIGATTATTGRFTSVTTPSVTATTTDLTLSAISTGNLNLNTAGGTGLRVSDVASSVRYVTFNGAGASGSPGFFASAGSLAQSSGATSNINFYTNLFAQEQMRIAHTASAVNRIEVTGAATTKAPIVSMQGSDTNISMAFQPKGTGAIDLAAGSSGVNISNGGTVTAITRTASGGLYTSIPSVAISAPTTAGGTTATASAALFIQTVTIQSGGTGYTVGDVLTVVGGTSIAAATLTVNTVSSGVITAVTVTTGGTSYTALPTNPFSVTGGTGSSATFNATAWGVSATITVTAAGSGYIEQPTVTFSGGGGSGATAYATVGSGTIVRGIGSTMDFANPNGVGLRVNSTAISSNLTDYVELSGGASGVTNGVYVRAGGSTTNNSVYIQSKGTGSISFFTNWTTSAAEQMRVSHTASAVNYVQVTGSATGNGPIISAQGSDTNLALNLTAKGTTGVVNIWTNNSGVIQFTVAHTASAVNRLQATGSAAGASPVLSAIGTDTDIDLTLTPKGTGNVKFGTYTAGVLTATGYVTIKDSGGTTRRLLVG